VRAPSADAVEAEIEVKSRKGVHHVVPVGTVGWAGLVTVMVVVPRGVGVSG
jgi:hypothetical protein